MELVLKLCYRVTDHPHMKHLLTSVQVEEAAGALQVTLGTKGHSLIEIIHLKMGGGGWNTLLLVHLAP